MMTSGFGMKNRGFEWRMTEQEGWYVTPCSLIEVRWTWQSPVNTRYTCQHKQMTYSARNLQRGANDVSLWI